MREFFTGFLDRIKPVVPEIYTILGVAIGLNSITAFQTRGVAAGVTNLVVMVSEFLLAWWAFVDRRRKEDLEDAGEQIGLLAKDHFWPSPAKEDN